MVGHFPIIRLNSLGTVLLTDTGRIVDIQSDRKQFEEK
jgi:hypothetical protein